MTAIQKEDIDDFIRSFALSDDLKDKTFLITGVTGLIGLSLVNCLLALDKRVRIIAPVRDMRKAKEIEELNDEAIYLIECDLKNFEYSDKVDYIIHCVTPTASKFFIEYPVETFDCIYNVSQHFLEMARKMEIKGFVYLSSLEVYGTITDDDVFVTEDRQGYLNPLDVRSSYPMAKRAVESLCYMYAKQYGLNVMVARLTQTTGAGISKNDNRVIAQFTRLAAQGKDIVLHTNGEASRPYCYVMDCVSAILYILLKGKSGEAYNVANQNTYISARGMAEYLRDNFNSSINVRVELNDAMGYAPVTKLRLSVEKLVNLGWMPQYELWNIFDRLMKYLKE